MKKLWNRLLPVSLCLALFANPAFAEPDPETAEAVKTLMKTLEVEKQMTPVFEGMKKMQQAMIEEQQLSDEEREAVLKAMAASMDEIEAALSWKNLEDLMVRAYSSVFTTKEVNDLNEMFQSPAGQVFIQKQPALQVATMKEMQTIMVDLMPKIQEKTLAAIEEARNANSNAN